MSMDLTDGKSTWANVDPDPWHHVASLGHNELNHLARLHFQFAFKIAQTPLRLKPIVTVTSYDMLTKYRPLLVVKTDQTEASNDTYSINTFKLIA